MAISGAGVPTGIRRAPRSPRTSRTRGRHAPFGGAVRLLRSLDGIQARTAQMLLGEFGTDMSPFPTDQALRQLGRAMPENGGASAFPDGVTTTDTRRQGISDALECLPSGLRRTLTWDQGKELAADQQLTAQTGTPVFVCDAHSPWQRGSNEDVNGLLRDYFPKGTDLSVHTAEHILRVAAEVNDRPRKTLGGQRPASLFNADRDRENMISTGPGSARTAMRTGSAKRSAHR